MSNFSNPQKQARASRRNAELAVSRELIDWHRAEKAKIDADTELGEIARVVAVRDLLMEFGRRSKKALSKARRDNTLPKILERQIRAEIEAEHVEKRRGWTS